MSVLSLCLNAVIEGMLLTKSDSDKLTYAKQNFPTLIGWTSQFPFCGMFFLLFIIIITIIIILN